MDVADLLLISGCLHADCVIDAATDEEHVFALAYSLRTTGCVLCHFRAASQSDPAVPAGLQGVLHIFLL